jgi:hypothetical protein
VRSRERFLANLSSQILYQTILLCQRNKISRQDWTIIGVTPACQEFEAPDFAGAQLDHRLEEGDHFISFQGTNNVWQLSSHVCPSPQEEILYTKVFITAHPNSRIPCGRVPPVNGIVSMPLVCAATASLTHWQQGLAGLCPTHHSEAQLCGCLHQAVNRQASKVFKTRVEQVLNSNV